MFVEGFDDLDSMFKRMAEAEDAANAATTDAQRMIGTEGGPRFWFRYVGEMDLFVFGEASPVDEAISLERQCYGDEPDADDLAEFAYVEQSTRLRYDRGYRFGTAYSVACPEGELGDTHVSAMMPLDDEDFEVFRSAGWDPGESSGGLQLCYEVYIRASRMLARRERKQQ